MVVSPRSTSGSPDRAGLQRLAQSNPDTGLPYVNWAEVEPSIKESFKGLLSGVDAKVVYFCGVVLKIGRRVLAEQRVLMISHDAVYQCMTSNEVNRCVPISRIAEVLVSDDHWLGLRVPTEYDMLFSLTPQQVKDVVHVLTTLYRHITGGEIVITRVRADSIKSSLQLKRPKNWRLTNAMLLPFLCRRAVMRQHRESSPQLQIAPPGADSPLPDRDGRSPSPVHHTSSPPSSPTPAQPTTSAPPPPPSNPPPSSPAARTSSPVPTLRSRLVEFFLQHNPMRVREVDSLICRMNADGVSPEELFAMLEAEVEGSQPGHAPHHRPYPPLQTPSQQAPVAKGGKEELTTQAMRSASPGAVAGHARRRASTPPQQPSPAVLSPPPPPPQPPAQPHNLPHADEPYAPGDIVEQLVRGEWVPCRVVQVTPDGFSFQGPGVMTHIPREQHTRLVRPAPGLSPVETVWSGAAPNLLPPPPKRQSSPPPPPKQPPSMAGPFELRSPPAAPPPPPEPSQHPLPPPSPSPRPSPPDLPIAPDPPPGTPPHTPPQHTPTSIPTPPPSQPLPLQSPPSHLTQQVSQSPPELRELLEHSKDLQQQIDGISRAIETLPTRMLSPYSSPLSGDLVIENMAPAELCRKVLHDLLQFSPSITSVFQCTPGWAFVDLTRDDLRELLPHHPCVVSLLHSFLVDYRRAKDEAYRSPLETACSSLHNVQATVELARSSLEGGPDTAVSVQRLKSTEKLLTAARDLLWSVIHDRPPPPPPPPPSQPVTSQQGSPGFRQVMYLTPPQFQDALDAEDEARRTHLADEGGLSGWGDDKEVSIPTVKKKKRSPSKKPASRPTTPQRRKPTPTPLSAFGRTNSPGMNPGSRGSSPAQRNSPCRRSLTPTKRQQYQRT